VQRQCTANGPTLQHYLPPMSSSGAGLAKAQADVNGGNGGLQSAKDVAES